jgi:hypothetical protein
MLLLIGAAVTLVATSMGLAPVPVALVLSIVGLVSMYVRPAVGLLVLVLVVYTNAAAVAENFHGITLFNKLLLPLLMGLLALRGGSSAAKRRATCR